jgi:hypothetical protein
MWVGYIMPTADMATKSGGEKPEGREQRTEARGQRSEDRGQIMKRTL